MTDEASWSNTWHQHLTGLAADNDLAVAVLDLHKPNKDGDCDGCDAEGYEWEAPDWGCSTVRLIADHYGHALEVRCPSCGGERRGRVDGKPVGHHVREGDMLVSCPGSPETVESFPWRSEAEAMADLTQRISEMVAARMDRLDDSALVGVVSPLVPPAVAAYSVAKYAQEIQVASQVLSAANLELRPQP